MGGFQAFLDSGRSSAAERIFTEHAGAAYRVRRGEALSVVIGGRAETFDADQRRHPRLCRLVPQLDGPYADKLARSRAWEP